MEDAYAYLPLTSRSAIAPGTDLGAIFARLGRNYGLYWQVINIATHTYFRRGDGIRLTQRELDSIVNRVLGR